MALLKQVKQNKKSTISIQVSKNLADEFNSAIEIYNKNYSNNSTLDFEPLIKKIIKELNVFNGITNKDKSDKKLKNNDSN